MALIQAIKAFVVTFSQSLDTSIQHTHTHTERERERERERDDKHAFIWKPVM
jgi:hypothetical protein